MNIRQIIYSKGFKIYTIFIVVFVLSTQAFCAFIDLEQDYCMQLFAVPNSPALLFLFLAFSIVGIIFRILSFLTFSIINFPDISFMYATDRLTFTLWLIIAWLLIGLGLRLIYIKIRKNK